jgi:hypothetical protein
MDSFESRVLHAGPLFTFWLHPHHRRPVSYYLLRVRLYLVYGQASAYTVPAELVRAV